MRAGGVPQGLSDCVRRGKAVAQLDARCRHRDCAMSGRAGHAVAPVVASAPFSDGTFAVCVLRLFEGLRLEGAVVAAAAQMMLMAIEHLLMRKQRNLK